MHWAVGRPGRRQGVVGGEGTIAAILPCLKTCLFHLFQLRKYRIWLIPGTGKRLRKTA